MGMKCINCGADNNLQDRTDHAGRCKKCNHPFTLYFQPRLPVQDIFDEWTEPIKWKEFLGFKPSNETNKKLKLTDKFFEKAINDLSMEGSLFFTPKQLHYFLDRRLNKEELFSYFYNLCFCSIIPMFFGWRMAILICIMLSPIFYSLVFWLRSRNLTNASSTTSIKDRLRIIMYLRILLILTPGLIIAIIYYYNLYISSFWLYILFSFIGVSGLYLLQRLRNRQVNIQQQFVLTEIKFEEIVKRWESINSPINKMLPISSQQNIPANIPADVTAYSFDRAVICDRPSIAQMLIANNFHFEHSCAVLSVTGYPESIFETVITMLKRNPNLKVYVLHDASPKGVSLANYIRTNEQWFTDSNIAIYDVGLFPRQVFASQESMFVINGTSGKSAINQLPDAVKNSLSTKELAWLALGNIVELESFTPQKIMQVLSQAMNSSITANSQSSLFSTDHLADAYFYSETFG